MSAYEPLQHDCCACIRFGPPTLSELVCVDQKLGDAAAHDGLQVIGQSGSGLKG